MKTNESFLIITAKVLIFSILILAILIPGSLIKNLITDYQEKKAEVIQVVQKLELE